MGLLSLSMCAILRVERKHSHILLLVDRPGDARDNFWCQHWIQSLL